MGLQGAYASQARSRGGSMNEPEEYLARKQNYRIFVEPLSKTREKLNYRENKNIREAASMQHASSVIITGDTI